MRLQLTVWAEDLPTSLLGGTPHVYCSVTRLDTANGNDLLGTTEVLASASPDWTKFFYIEDFELGREVKLVVSIYHAKNKKSLGSTLFSVNSILGKPGSILAKELKKGGIVAVHAEPASSKGQLTLQLRGLDLKNTEGGGLLRKSDPFFEIQRLRTSCATGARVWDTVYRSESIDNNLSPVWPTVSLEVAGLTGSGSLESTMIRLLVLDHNANGKHVSMGYIDVTIQELIDAATETALFDVERIDMDKAIVLKKKDRPVGHLLVAKAEITGLPELAEPPQAPKVEKAQAEENPVKLPPPPEVVEEEEDVVFEPEDDDLQKESPTFLNYVAGGCELRACIAIDATKSNGDPRQATSLHHFNRGHNAYEHTLLETLSVLSEYDSDQKYPIYGLGLKKEGVVQHAWPFAEGQVEGVAGVLKAYNDTMRSGIIMSQPRDFSEVIALAAKDASAAMAKKQSYSILLICTNGMPEDLAKTGAALEACEDAPLSVVLVGVGDDKLDTTVLADWNTGRDKVSMVQFGQGGPDFLQAALSSIPDQLVAYMVKKDIAPLPEPEEELEVVVAAYDSDDDVSVDVETGEMTWPQEAAPVQPVSVPADVPVAAPAEQGTETNETEKVEDEDHDAFQKRLEKMKRKAKRKAKRVRQRAEKRFGRVRARAKRRANRLKQRLKGDGD